MQLHDSLSRGAKAFPEDGNGPVSIYACGPTVYHYASIGNLRTFLTTDLLRRYLEYKGREVRLVMNITDVGHMLNDADTGEDKMTAAAAKEGKTPEAIARFYEEAFFRDLDALNFKRAWKHPRATEHIPQMIALVELLLDAGKAYVTAKNDVYFDVASFKAYGRLSGNSVEELVAGARVEVKEDKKHPADFALWIHNPNHVMQWKGPRGIQGYPGWHLECSAMARQYLGDTLDLHVGGEDLKFPHHECEIAQSESATGQPFSRHWLHVSFLLVEGEKMSKSKGNTYTLQDLVAKGYSPAAVRWLLLSAHYRTQLNFTLQGLDAAEKTVRYFRDTYERLGEISSDADGSTYGEGLAVAALRGIDKTLPEEPLNGLDDDLNVSKTIAVIHSVVVAANSYETQELISRDGANALRQFMRTVIEDIFGITLSVKKEIPDIVRVLADERQAARVRKDWKESDRLRDELAVQGWVIEDSSDGYKLKRA